ncbi:MAG TPA: S-layer homology domain-containing protein, partial [Thermoanaerobaculia bacterium]|nr:S-layer homology domain-containing protein [Thermoanaerobaculia bacterium]
TAWENEGLTTTTLSGHTSQVSDSNGLDTMDPDADATYGTLIPGAQSDCLYVTGDCYQFGFQNIPRPSQHWDTYFDETLSPSDPHHRWAKRWTVHAGLSFSDVSSATGYYRDIENIFHNGITGGCGAGIFCPTNPVTRAQMAVFLLKSKHGKSFVPPACTGIFQDVPCPSPFADWIEELYGEGITAGCSVSPALYCPDDAVTRQQMAVFLLKARNGSGYTPPACGGIFADVACPSPFADWIETLFALEITAGCSRNPQLYCPTAPNVRQQMAVFLTKTFYLVLYGP